MINYLVQQVVKSGSVKDFRLTSDDVHFVYDTRLKRYANGSVLVTNYRSSIMAIKPGAENADKGTSGILEKRSATYKKNKSDTSLQELRKDNLSRTRTRLTDYVNNYSGTWFTFVTLTFKACMGDVTVANKMLANWVRSCKRLFPDFTYIGVPEFQKRGAIHYHLLTNVPVGSALIPMQKVPIYSRSIKSGKRRIDYYNLKYWSYGFSSAFDLTAVDENFSVVKYMCKYLYKDFDKRLWGRKKILKSSSLQLPTVVKMNSLDLSFDDFCDLRSIDEDYSIKEYYYIDKPSEASHVIESENILYIRNSTLK